MMPGVPIFLWSPMTLTFDLLTPKVDRFLSLPCGSLVPICIELHSLSHYHVHVCKFGN